MNSICEELGIPKKLIKTTTRDDRFIALVHRSWLKSLIKYGKLTEYTDKNAFETWPYSQEELGQGWVKIFICVYKKKDAKVIPLPRIRKNVKDEPPLLFCQLLQYISQTNYKNLWKEAYKKYNTSGDASKDTHILLADYNDVIREIIIRTYGCPVVNICDEQKNTEQSKCFDTHANVLPAVCCVETVSGFYTLHLPHINHNLSDCLTFSPAILSKCYTKPLFLVYQLLQTLKSLHDRSLTLGDIKLSDIYLTEDLWLMIFPQLNSNIYIQDLPKLDIMKNVISNWDCRKTGHKFDLSLKCQNCGIRTYDKVQVIGSETLSKLCQLWVDGQISNFTYLTALNNLSGRKFGNPNCHHVFPWVTDFSSRSGKNWRDLKKSKYRLNKGDRQLDLTYENSQSEVAHHVSDVLSSITYYVYMARRTPKSVLCKHVRPIWVPEEYPSSIKRLQEWSPDECIPEFYSDPTVFKTIHEDLDDLEVPNWSSSPEDFVDQHREALESSHVSERLHHWIDLSFGYKLTGQAAVKAKNVCLQLVDEHSNLTNSGLVQLFSNPHPPRATQSPFFNKAPPKIFVHKQIKKSRDHSTSSTTMTDISRSEDELALEEELASNFSNSRSLGFSRFLSRSRQSLNEDAKEQKTNKPSSCQRSASLGPKNPSFTSHVSQPRTRQLSIPAPIIGSGVIYLPKEYNPAHALNNLENMYNFFSKTFHKSLDKSNQQAGCSHQSEVSFEEFIPESLQYDDTSRTSFTNFIYSENFEAKVSRTKATKSYTFPIDYQNIYPYRSRGRTTSQKVDNEISCNYAEIIATRRIKELQILGCLIMEIFLPKQLRALGSVDDTSFSKRLDAALTILRTCKNEIPPCIKYVVTLLLQPELINRENFKYPAVSNFGLPPPSAHLLLEPLLNSIIPFYKKFLFLYNILTNIKNFCSTSEELDILYHFDCDGILCTEYETLEKTKVLFAQNISECKVKLCAQQLEVLLRDVNLSTDKEVIHILVPYIKDMIVEPPTSVLACWYLFDPIARALGPHKTTDIFLQPILKLYESNLPNNGKIAKLYHHSFLLRLIVRLGLKCFLEYFVTPLVEAVGGYKDLDNVDYNLHNHSEKSIRKTSNLKMMEAEQHELSPSDDSSSSDRNLSSQKDASLGKGEPEIFEFENDEPSTENEPLQSLIEHLELNVTNDLPFNHSTAEEALEAFDDIHIHNIDDLCLNLSDDEETYKPSLMSPTIPIPNTTNIYNKELTNISCNVGSKNTDSEDLIEPQSESSQYDANLDSPSVSSDQQRSIEGHSASFGSTTQSSTKTISKRRNEAEISDMSSDSLLWLSHRLGPVLTARYLTRNLLKMLTLCYVGKENLAAASKDDTMESSWDTCDLISIASSYVIGDRNAAKVLECLSSIAALYGEQIILLQYLPHMSELIALCKRRLTLNLEGGLISCLALLKHIIPYLSDATLMDQLHDTILKNIIHPTVRLLGSTKYCFPNGSVSRNVLARKYLDALYILSLRMGADMTKTHLAVPALQRFFLIFEKVSDEGYYRPCINLLVHESQYESAVKDLEDCNFVEIRREPTTTEYTTAGKPIHISHVLLGDAESIESLSPTPPQPSNPDTEDTITHKALDEIRMVFKSELAHAAYVPFLKQIGHASLESALKNHSTIHTLCQAFEKELKEQDPNRTSYDPSYEKLAETPTSSKNLESNVSLVGNRIEVQSHPETGDVKNTDILSLISNKMDNSSRHLRGNWLAYWEHEIGRSDKDTMFNFKQIKLQTFTGHTHSIKSLYVLDNENSFMSGSRDKTIKLWSLRSQGDGSSISTCQWTYTAHKKSVLSITFLESLRLCASCDSVVHIWDPFMGGTVKQLDSPKFAPVNVIKSMPAPSPLIFAATTEGTVKVIDSRLCSYIHELKVTLNATSLIRCLAISPSGTWIAAGQSSGNITVLDTRTGLVLCTFRAHESEVLQMVAYGEDTLISSSFDQTISVWNVPDGKFRHSMKGTTEPVHCLNLYNNELISGTTANRVGVHTSVSNNASFSSTKLRSDTFRGLLTSMAVLPLNRLLLLGADSGNISLLC